MAIKSIHPSHADRTPDLIAFGITLLMTCVLATGASKSVMFNNALNAINFATWVFIMAAGLFYVDTDIWHEHDGFLPFGWSGVSSMTHSLACDVRGALLLDHSVFAVAPIACEI